MKKFTFILTIFFLSAANLVSAQSVKKQGELIKDAEAAKAEFLESDWQMEKHFKNSHGYAIFPNVGKAGLGVGGASGNGVAYEQGASIGMAKLSQLTIGFQAGARPTVKSFSLRMQKPWVNLKKISMNLPLKPLRLQ